MSRHVLPVTLILAFFLNACLPAGSAQPVESLNVPTVPAGTGAQVMAPTAPAPDPAPGPTATAPFVMDHQPKRSRVTDLQPETWLTFNRPMDRASVARALSVSPGVPFILHWDRN